MVTISTHVRRFDIYRALAEAHESVFCTVGTHPHSAAAEPDVPVDEIAALSRHPRCVAIGEAGLDYYYDKSPRDVQQRVFRTHIAAARETGLPLVIHARDADADMIRILEEEMRSGPYRAVLHCFSSGAALAEAGVELGFYVSFSGILTFKKSEELRRIAAALPRDRLLVETDAPYLAPDAAPRPHQRARLRGAYGEGSGRDDRRQRNRHRPADHGQFLPPVRKGRDRRPRRRRGRRMSLRVKILGCGSSGGVPRVGSGWGACDPREPKNRRRRCSILVERCGPDGKTSVLIDTTPDLREQLLDAEVRRLDAVLFTHEHADHTHGIDDLRPLVIAMRRRMPVYMDRITGELLMAPLRLLLRGAAGQPVPADPRRAADDGRDDGNDRRAGRRDRGGAVPPRPRRHRCPRLPLRRSLPTRPTSAAFPTKAGQLFEGLDVLILDALRHAPHPTHFSVAEALAVIERVRPRRAILTNLHTDLDYATLSRELPAGIEPAYDGLTIDISVGAEPALSRTG